MHYYIVDTETNGVKAGYHEINQISIIRYDDRVQLNRYIRAIYPERSNAQSLAITGRTIEDIKKGVSREEAVEACNAFFEQDGKTPEHRCIVAHNASFDRRFCHELWSSVGAVFPAACWLDTMTCVNNYMKLSLGIEKPKKGLHDALQTCGLKPIPGAHDAISDTQNTYILKYHLIKQGFDILPYIKRIPQKEDE